MRLSRPQPDAAIPPRLLLLAPANSYRIAPYVRAAAELGVSLLIASHGRHSLVCEVAEGLQIDLDDADAALSALTSALDRHPVNGVVATDDATVELANRTAAAFGLPHNPVDAVRCARRKDLARARLAAAGVPVLAYRRIAFDQVAQPDQDDFPFPAVIKPLALSGSRGVMRVESPAELPALAERLRAIVADLPSAEERGHLLLEQFIPGHEVALEGMLYDGNLQVLAIFDKPEPLDGPFFEESYYITPSRHTQTTQALIRERVADACAAYGLTQGPVHAELRLHDGEAWIIEVAARTIGGQCARLLQFGTGYSLEQLVLRQALGHPIENQAEIGAAGVLMIPIPRAGLLRRIEGVLAAQRVSCIEDIEISVREGYELVPLPEGASYLGFIFARGPTPGQVEQALREAHACLRIVTAPVWKMAGENMQ